MLKFAVSILLLLSVGMFSHLQGRSILDPNSSPPFQDDFFDLLNKLVYEAQEMPQRDQVILLFEEIKRNGFAIERGSDDLRVKYVAMQGLIEKSLIIRSARGEITELVGVIHTPTPATPLCTEPCTVNPDLLDEKIRVDQDKVWTIYARAQIIRDYLGLGGMLYVVYPQGGLEQRTPAQQAVYKNALQTYPGNLIDLPLPIDKIDPDMIGATYLFHNQEKRLCAFSIKARQANDPQDFSEWGIWFGYLDQEEISTRVNTVYSYLDDQMGPFKEDK